MKYIVKNCPAFCDNTRQCRGAYDRKISHQYCSGNNDVDCPLKQILELCKEELKPVYIFTGNLTGVSTPCYKGGYNLAQDILNLLEIEEEK